MAEELTNQVPNWAQVRGLAWMSLAHHSEQLTPSADQSLIAERVDGLARELYEEWQKSAYRVPMRGPRFAWGSDGVAMTNAMLMLEGYRLRAFEGSLEAA